MTEEDEAFNEIERRAKQRMESVRVAMRGVEDDDIQDYKKPWVGLTNDEIDFQAKKDDHGAYFALGALWAEAKLKEKNT